MPLLLLIALTTGCQATVGNYFAERGRDFGECFLVQVGAGLGLGADVKTAGVVHATVGLAAYLPETCAGWVYGEFRPADSVTGIVGLGITGEGDIGFVFSHASFRSFNGRASIHKCNGVFPAVLSWEKESPDDIWLWGEETVRSRRATILKARVHAFDIEASVFIGIVGAARRL